MNTEEKVEQTTANTPAPEVKTEETKTEAPPKLSRREALEVGIEVAKDRETSERETRRPTKKKVVEISDPSTEEVAAKEEKAAPKYEPPAEFTSEEKENFLKSTPEQQAVSLRLFEGYQKRRADLARDLQENGWVKDLAKDVMPFLQSTGEKLTPHQALTQALKLRKELEDGDPVANAIAILERKGKPVPEELRKLAAGTEAGEDPKYLELRKELDEVKSERQKENITREATPFLADWEKFEKATNAAKTSMFPDVNNSEAGAKLAAEIGSLVGGRTAISSQFIAKVKERLPNAGRVELFAEAYRFLGGRVDDSKPVESRAAKETHLNRSNRAAASVPGSGSSFNPTPKLKLSRRAALQKAWDEAQK